MSFVIKIEMHFYVTKTPDGRYHVQNFIRGLRGQHHLHNAESYKRWKKAIDPECIHASKGTCNCELTRSGDVREYDGREWHNERFEK